MTNKVFSFIESFLTRVYLWKQWKFYTAGLDSDVKDLGPCSCWVLTIPPRGRGKILVSFSARATLNLSSSTSGSEIFIKPQDDYKGRDLRRLCKKQGRVRLRLEPINLFPAHKFTSKRARKESILTIYSAWVKRRKRGWVVFGIEQIGKNKQSWGMG